MSENVRYAVIMAGGSGERFWPLSRKLKPKQLLRLTSPTETLIEEAVNRIQSLVGADRVVIATARHLEDAIRGVDIVESANVIAEPDKRNTLGCLVWAAAELSARHEPGAAITLAILTADHKIDHPAAFRDTVHRALKTAEETGALVTIGVVPDRPETGYGYIELDDEVLGHGSKVKSFREKPSLTEAQHYLEEGRFLWNSGMFFWTLESFYEELRVADPATEAIARQIAAHLREKNGSAAEAAFRELPNRSIDYALMERAKQVAVVPAEFPWDDVGAWDALERSMPCDERGNVEIGDVLAIDVDDTILYNTSDKQKLTAVGVRDIVVVVSGDAILVTTKQNAQRVKEIVEKLDDGLR